MLVRAGGLGGRKGLRKGEKKKQLQLKTASEKRIFWRCVRWRCSDILVARREGNIHLLKTNSKKVVICHVCCRWRIPVWGKPREVGGEPVVSLDRPYEPRFPCKEKISKGKESTPHPLRTDGGPNTDRLNLEALDGEGGTSSCQEKGGKGFCARFARRGTMRGCFEHQREGGVEPPN